MARFHRHRYGPVLLNSGPPRNSCQYKGVYWDKANQRWVSRIVVSYKDIYIGSFSSELEAAHAYDIAARKHYGQFANTNFDEQILADADDCI